MNNKFEQLSKTELLELVRARSKHEQRLTIEVLALIREVDIRRLYLELGFSSLFDLVTQDLGYEPTSAYRRISAARLINAVPATEEKLRNGELSLSVVSKAQTFFRQEEKRTGTCVPKVEKIEILRQLENLSAREAEKILIKKSPENIKFFEKERPLTSEFTELRIVLDQELKAELDDLKLLLAHQSPNLSYVDLIRLMVNKTRESFKYKNRKFNQNLSEHTNSRKKKNFSEALVCVAKPQEKLKFTKEDSIQRSHERANYQDPEDFRNPVAEVPKFEECFDFKTGPLPIMQTRSDSIFESASALNLSDTAVSEWASLLPTEPAFSSNPQIPLHQHFTLSPFTVINSDAGAGDPKRTRYIPAKIKSKVWNRDKGCCQFIAQATGRKCGSKYFIEFDHIHRFSEGGSNDVSNLRLLCRNHNQYRG